MIQPSKVAEGIWRGCEPSSDEDYQALKRLGVLAVLDLETGHGFDGYPETEARVAKEYGMELFSLPLSKLLPPSSYELERARQIIDQFKPIYVHCKAGVDRTGMVIAYFQMANGRTKEQAIREMKIMGMHWWYYWWAWFL